MSGSTGAAVRNHRNAVRDRSESCPLSIGITVRFRRNPHQNQPIATEALARIKALYVSSGVEF